MFFRALCKLLFPPIPAREALLCDAPDVDWDAFAFAYENADVLTVARLTRGNVATQQGVHVLTTAELDAQREDVRQSVAKKK